MAQEPLWSLACWKFFLCSSRKNYPQGMPQLRIHCKLPKRGHWSCTGHDWLQHYTVRPPEGVFRNLLIAGYHQPRGLQKLLTKGTRSYESQRARNPWEKHSELRKKAPFSTQHPLVTKSKVVPACKEEIKSCPPYSQRRQWKMNLELRDKKLITDTRPK